MCRKIFSKSSMNVIFFWNVLGREVSQEIWYVRKDYQAATT